MSVVETSEAARMIGLADWLRAGSVAAVPVTTVDPAAELERARRAVFDDAREQGHREGLRRADDAIAAAETEARRRIAATNEGEAARLRTERERLAALIAAVPAAVQAQEASILDAAIAIALAALSRLFGESRADADALAALCRRALEESRHRPVTLKVAPEDVERIRAACAADDVRVVADAGVDPGDCELHGARGIYATGLDRRLAGLRNVLMSARGDAPSGGGAP